MTLEKTHSGKVLCMHMIDCHQVMYCTIMYDNKQQHYVGGTGDSNDTHIMVINGPN